MTVTNNSAGTGVTGSAVASLSPTPPISNCLGKFVVLLVASTVDATVSSITGATYYLAGTGGATTACRVYCKNGEASEPTPTVNFGGAVGDQMSAQIFVYDITTDTFPTIAADGQGVLASFGTAATATVMFFGQLTVVGGGWAIQCAMKGCAGGGWSFTSVDTTSGYTMSGAVAKTAGAAGICAAVQLKNVATVFGSNITATSNTIHTESSSDVSAFLTIEFSVGNVSTPYVQPLPMRVIRHSGRYV